MRKVFPAMAFALLVLGGCAAPRGGAVLGPGQGTNLALGPWPLDTLVATEMAYRADWPAVEHGYRFEDVTIYSRFSYDYLSGYDRFGGTYYGSESVESGVHVR